MYFIHFVDKYNQSRKHNSLMLGISNTKVQPQNATQETFAGTSCENTSYDGAKQDTTK